MACVVGCAHMVQRQVPLLDMNDVQVTDLEVTTRTNWGLLNEKVIVTVDITILARKNVAAIGMRYPRDEIANSIRQQHAALVFPTKRGPAATKDGLKRTRTVEQEVHRLELTLLAEGPPGQRRKQVRTVKFAIPSCFFGSARAFLIVLGEQEEQIVPPLDGRTTVQMHPGEDNEVILW